MNIILFEEKPPEGRIPIEDPRADHIIKVLRSKAGDSLLLGLIDGPYGEARIRSIDKDAVYVDWNPDRQSPELFEAELLVGQVRPICMKRILREAVSLGVQRIRVTGADLAEKSYQDSHLWTRGEYVSYLVHGAVQAVSTRIPELILTKTLDEVDIPDTAYKIMLDPRRQQFRLADLNLAAEKRPVVLAIGPERGWSERELGVFDSLGFVSAGMGERILRTETACAVGLGLVLSSMGCM
jgi:RsmE family RNA methyltransferase